VQQVVRLGATTQPQMQGLSRYVPARNASVSCLCLRPVVSRNGGMGRGCHLDPRDGVLTDPGLRLSAHPCRTPTLVRARTSTRKRQRSPSGDYAAKMAEIFDAGVLSIAVLLAVLLCSVASSVAMKLARDWEPP
jgi:hypothetical protein